jgi:hypothetical protein
LAQESGSDSTNSRPFHNISSDDVEIGVCWADFLSPNFSPVGWEAHANLIIVDNNYQRR